MDDVGKPVPAVSRQDFNCISSLMKLYFSSYKKQNHTSFMANLCSSNSALMKSFFTCDHLKANSRSCAPTKT